jgi:anti-sigma factor RsiW
MSCSMVDIKAYFLGELEGRDKAAAESHLGGCGECRDEMERLGVMRSALEALPQEEVPRRIAFVSDKVFEPRWYQAIWKSGPVMGFASAALLAGAILVHGFAQRPEGSTLAAKPVVAVLDTAQMDRRIQEQVREQVGKRVDAAIAEQKQQTAQLLEASEKRYEQQRQKDLAAVNQVVRYYDQQMARWMVASNDQAAVRSAQ